MNQTQPIFILPEGYQRTVGRDAQRNNILAAKQVAETVRTTLGPKGMDKMIVDSMGDVIVTNDGVTILEEMGIEHPAAKMLVEVAKTQENLVGDGTTTAVIIAGELLKNAEELLDKNIHPTVISKGYRIAAEQSQKLLNRIAENVDEKDEDILIKIAITAMTGKGAESAKENLAKITVDAIKQIIDRTGSELVIDLENIKLEKRVGGGVQDTELIKGLLIDKEKVHPGMPHIIKNARVALLDSAIEIKITETDAKIQISDPMQMQAFIDQEEKIIRNMVDGIIRSGANAVFCQKGIDDMAQHYLAKANIYAARRVKKSDIDKLSLATGAKIVSSIKDLSKADIGFAGLIEETRIGDEEMTSLKECKNPKAVTILMNGGTEHVVDEVERAIKDALGDISIALKDGKIVAGAGGPEIEI